MNKKILSIAVGTAFVAAVSAGTVAASENPFGMSELNSGYQFSMSIMPEGSCGGDKAKDGKCGEGKCGGDKKAKEAKCGGDKKAKDGKCGEGKCGGSGM